MKASGGALLVVVALGILWLVVTGRADGVLSALSGAAAKPSTSGATGSAFDSWIRGIMGISGQGASSTPAPAGAAPILQLNPLPSYPGYSTARTA